MPKENMKKLSAWEKIAVTCAIVNALSLPVWISIQFKYFPDSIGNHIPTFLCAMLTLFIPFIWFAVFNLWHWHTRYSGKHQLGWAIIFVIGAMPFFEYFPLGMLLMLAYFCMNVLPDIRGKTLDIIDAGNKRTVKIDGKYQTLKSTFFISGWLSISLGFIFAIATGIITFISINKLELNSQGWEGQTITKSMIGLLWVLSQTCKIYVITALMAVILATAGAILLYISQNMRWRLLEQKEKEDLSKGI